MNNIVGHQQTARMRADISPVPGVFRKKLLGFTLIELVVVIAIIGILAAIAWPTYTDQVRKARRSDGKAALQEVAARLEQFYLDNKRYTATSTDLGYGATIDSPERWYTVSITTGTVACPAVSCYVLTATPVATKDQAKDTKCANLTFTSQQVKGASGPLGRECW